MIKLPFRPQLYSAGSKAVSSQWKLVGDLARVGVLVPLFAMSASIAHGQEADQAMNEQGEPLSIMLRGTTGSGQQEALFPQPVQSSLATDESADTVRDTSDPIAQLQGRARPAQPESQVVDPLSTGTPTANSNVRAPAEQLGTGAVVESDPFAPTGFRVGTWQVNASSEHTIGYSNNINSAPMGEESAFSETQVDLSLQSDWSRHSARIDASGNLRKALNSNAEDLPRAGVIGALNLDLVDGLALNLRANYDYATESVTSTNLTSATTTRPGVHVFGGSAELARTDRKLFYSLRGSVGRTVYEDVELSAGGTQPQNDRYNTLYTLTGRVGYEMTPALAPFVELEGGIRDYDKNSDRNGNNRDSVILAARTGLDIDISEKLSGEISVGYQTEQFDDDELEDLSSVTLDGNLVWSPARDTTLTFNAQTGLSESTTAGQNGAIVFGAGVLAERQITDRLSVSANAAIDITRQDDGSRTDHVVTAGAGFNYWLNRFMALTGRVEHTKQYSTEGPSEEYDDVTVQGGIKFQR